MNRPDCGRLWKPRTQQPVVQGPARTRPISLTVDIHRPINLTLNYKTWQLRMHCNLRPPEPSLKLRRHVNFVVTEPPLPYYSVIAITLRCNLDLLRLTLNICSVSLVTWWNSTKYERNRAIRSAVIAISIFDLMTLNMCYMLRSALG